MINSGKVESTWNRLESQLAIFVNLVERELIDASVVTAEHVRNAVLEHDSAVKELVANAVEVTLEPLRVQDAEIDREEYPGPEEDEEHPSPEEDEEEDEDEDEEEDDGDVDGEDEEDE